MLAVNQTSELEFLVIDLLSVYWLNLAVTSKICESLRDMEPPPARGHKPAAPK